MVTLLLTEKGGETKQLNFDKDEVTIGRVQGNDVVLPKGNVSKRHCRIMLQSGRFSVEDLKSTNGTYINGRKIAETTSVIGSDKIYVGDFVIKIENAGGEPVPAGAPEAGSLSTALPRRPPPPPAPGRATATMRAVDDEQMAEIRARGGRSALPPPPPPRRDPTPSPPAGLGSPDGLPDLEVGPPAASDVDMDDEPLPSRPRLSVPPLKSPRPLTEDGDHDDDVRTSHRERGASGLRARELSRDSGRDGALASHAPPGSADGLANWLRDLVSGPDTQAVYVNGSQLEIERDGRRQPAELPAGASLEEAIRALAARGSPRPSGDTRVINVMLPENARLAAIFPPVASGLSMTLQKLAPAGRSLQALVDSGTIPDEAKELLEACVRTRRNILIGGDGRSLDVLLEAVASAIPDSMRVVSLASNLSVPEGAGSWIKLASDTRVSDIVMAAASLRPDYLVVEVTAPPLATDVLGQCVLGQEGTIVTVAARSAADALQRLSALAGPALGGVAHARELAATAFDVVLCAGTQADGSVRLLEVGEPRSDGAGHLSVSPIVSFAQSHQGEGSGRYDVSARSSRLASTLGARGVHLSGALAGE
jgi:pilus assembly protein CpaF